MPNYEFNISELRKGWLFEKSISAETCAGYESDRLYCEDKEQVIKEFVETILLGDKRAKKVLQALDYKDLWNNQK